MTMGIQVSESSVIDGLTNQNKASIFPGYNGTDTNYIKITPAPDRCSNDVSVFYDTNFAIVATDASTLTELIDLAKGVIPVVTGSPTVNTIINGVDALNSAVNSAVDSETSSGTQEYRFIAAPCPENSDKEQCYKVTLLVLGTALMTDADPTDPEEQVELTMSLSVKDQVKTEQITHKKKSSNPQPITAKAEVDVKSSEPFLIYAKIDEYCETDGPGFLGGDSVSLIKIDAVKITITTVECDDTDEETQEEDGEKGSGKKTGTNSKVPEAVIGEKALKDLRKKIKRTKTK